jgi:hypothetical protein
MQTRKLSVLLLLLALFAFSANAQEDPGPGSVTVYSENGDNFTLFLNGQSRNATPTSRVVVDNFKEVPVSFRIVFEDKKIPEIKKKGIRQGKHCMFAIVTGKKGDRSLKVRGCSEEPEASALATTTPASQPVASTPSTSTPDQLSATYANGVITINDGRTIKVNKVKANGMTYPRVIMTALTGAKVTITYDDNTEKYSAETPFQYEVKDFQLNNAYFTLTVDEGGPAKTWKVKLQNANGYDLKLE